MNLLALLIAKTGAATVTTKIVVVGAVSVAAVGTAGATGAVPVAELLPGDDSAVVVQEEPVEDVLDDAPDAPAPDEGVETPEPDATTPEDPVLDEGDDVVLEHPRQNALDALERVQEKAPEQAQAGLARAREAVTGGGRGPASAEDAPEQDAPEQDERDAGSARGAGPGASQGRGAGQD